MNRPRRQGHNAGIFEMTKREKRALDTIRQAKQQEARWWRRFRARARRAPKWDWDRRLWAVRHSAPLTRPRLLGDAWDDGCWRGVERYEGEPRHCLLFRTRAAARKWCQNERMKVGPSCQDWRFQAVRVIESVREC
jgi:hypothetical protein